jgi:serine/threonine-protein kinase
MKPENVLLSDGHAVVADFGVAKALAAATHGGAGAESATATALGVAVGTPAYMAPEQVAADPATDHRADLYALGLIAYEALAGAHPYAGRAPQAMLAAHLTESPASLMERRLEMPPALAAVVARLLAKDPAARPQTAAEVLEAMDDVSMTSWMPGAGGRRTAAAVAAAITIALGVGAYVVWNRSPTTSPDTAAAAVRAVAVLPFVNTSGDPQDDYFSDGLTDELAHALAHVAGLQLAGRTSSYAFKGKSVTAPEIGKALGVVALVEGTVRRSGERLRVTTQLVRATDGTVLWDGAYESSSRDVFAVQDSLTRAVVAALAPTLAGRVARPDSGAVPKAVDVGRGTMDAEAYELYLKGRYYWLERGAANVARAIVYFQQAIARDSTFARADAALALAYNVLPVYVPDPSDSATPLLKASARRAVALDSTLADAQAAVAMAFERDFRFADAEAHYRIALAVEPSNDYVHHAFGFMLMSIGRTREAIDELSQATRLDPLAKSAGTAAAEALIDARRFQQAEDEARRILTIDPTFPLAIGTLGLAQALGGRPDSAVRTLEQGLRLYPERGWLQGRLLFAYAAAGRWDDADRMRTLLHRPGSDHSGGALPAFADFVLGDREPLMRLVTTRSGLRSWFDILRPTAAGSGCNLLVDPLWADARYRAATADLGLEPCSLARPWPFPARRASN